MTGSSNLFAQTGRKYPLPSHKKVASVFGIAKASSTVNMSRTGTAGPQSGGHVPMMLNRLFNREEESFYLLWNAWWEIPEIREGGSWSGDQMT